MKRQPTPQHITWFLDFDKTGQLDLEPPYQRKSVWSPKDRRFFLDTIFRNYPTPPIFVHRTVDDNGHTMFHVVDGKQRLETILKFAGNKIAIDKEFGDVNLDGKKFKDLEIAYKRKFWDYILVVDFIESVEGTNIEEVFDRVNRNSKNLQQQELRHARFSGWFINEVESQSESAFWWDIKVSTRAREKRMKNVQFISELMMVILENKFVGFNQDHINEIYANYDSIEEEDFSFDQEEYYSKRDKTISVLKQMIDHNDDVLDHIKTNNNLYTLWTLLVLEQEQISDIPSLCNNYLAFMNQVDTISQSDEPESLQQDEHNRKYFDYYFNSKGASTDYTQRKARYEALRLIL